MLPTMWLWMLNRDEEWYRELDAWEKVIFWHFKVGDTIMRLPKPFLYGYIFASLPEAWLDAQYSGDKALFGDALKEMGKGVLPGVWPAVAGPVVDVQRNKNFAGRPIVSGAYERLPAELQYDYRTPEVWKELGKVLGVSPMQLEHLAAGYTGGLTRRLADSGRFAATLAKEGPDGVALADLPVVGRLFTRDAEAPSRSLTLFYRRLDELRKKAEGETATPPELGELMPMEQAARDLSAMRKALNEAREAGRGVEVDQLNRLMALRLQAALMRRPSKREVERAGR